MILRIDDLIERREQLIVDRKGRKTAFVLQILVSLLLIVSAIFFSKLAILLVLMSTINSSLTTANYCQMADMQEEIENLSIIIENFKNCNQSDDIFNNNFYD